MTPALKELELRIESWRHLGIQQFSNGARKIGRAQHAGARAYLHSLMPPPCNRLVRGVELDLGRKLPSSLVAILEYSNGLYLFGWCLEILGVPTDLGRDPEGPPQPHSVAQYNSYSRPPNLAAEYFVCGGYGADGSHIVTDSAEAVFVCALDGSRLHHVGVDLCQFIVEEFDRLSLLFDRAGRLCTAEVATSRLELILPN